MRTTAIQLSLLFGIVAGLGQVVAGDSTATAFFSGVATGCLVLLVLFLGDWIVDRLSTSLERRRPALSEAIDPVVERDEGASDSALAA